MTANLPRADVERLLTLGCLVPQSRGPWQSELALLLDTARAVPDLARALLAAWDRAEAAEAELAAVRVVLADNPLNLEGYGNLAAEVEALRDSWHEHEQRDGDLSEVEAILHGFERIGESVAALRVAVLAAERDRLLAPPPASGSDRAE